MNAFDELNQTLIVWEDHQRLKQQKAEQGFTCKHCRNYVSSHMLFSGVQNRNHCPYCLWSRHLDLLVSGDRLAACKAQMQPIGLTLKQSHKKYALARQGELMIIHRCTGCGKLSVNRVAADDSAESILDVYEDSLLAGWTFDEIQPLNANDRCTVQARLFGIGRESLLNTHNTTACVAT